MTDEAARVAVACSQLRPADIRALHTRDGWGEYSSATFKRLLGLGLVDQNYHWTDLGHSVRAHLEIRNA